MNDEAFLLAHDIMGIIDLVTEPEERDEIFPVIFHYAIARLKEFEMLANPRRTSIVPSTN